MGNRAGRVSGAAAPYHLVATPTEGASQMVPEPSVLVALVRLIDHVPLPPRRRRRGRPAVYSDRLFLKALVIMIVKHLPRVHTLLAVLDQPTPEMQRLRALLTEDGHYPTRRTWERRLRAIPDSLPAQLGCLGRA